MVKNGGRKNMIDVIGYTRASTDGQCKEDKFGLDVQKQQIEEYCAKNDMRIIKWYTDEGESGAKERPGFDEIVYGDVNNPPYEAVIVAKSDRVARDINVYYYYKMLLIKKNIKLLSIAEDFGQFGVFASMLEAFTLCVAEMERENINKRTSAGRIMKSSKGGYSGGRTPYGYTAQHGKMVVVDDQAAVVRKIFEMKKSGSTYQQIVDALNKEGYVNKSGNKWAISSVQVILGNEKTYLGYYKYGKNGEWVEGEHQPILV
jgi:DNA invertase Pin-like site-specific DNA recombinase